MCRAVERAHEPGNLVGEVGPQRHRPEIPLPHPAGRFTQQRQRPQHPRGHEGHHGDGHHEKDGGKGQGQGHGMPDGVVDARPSGRQEIGGEIGKRLAPGPHGLGGLGIGRARLRQDGQGLAIGAQVGQELPIGRLADLPIHAGGEPPGQAVHGVEIVEPLAQARPVMVEQIVLFETPHFENVA